MSGREWMIVVGCGVLSAIISTAAKNIANILQEVKELRKDIQKLTSLSSDKH